jgi:hypothetical protein
MWRTPGQFLCPTAMMEGLAWQRSHSMAWLSDLCLTSWVSWKTRSVRMWRAAMAINLADSNTTSYSSVRLHWKRDELLLLLLVSTGDIFWVKYWVVWVTLVVDQANPGSMLITMGRVGQQLGRPSVAHLHLKQQGIVFTSEVNYSKSSFPFGLCTFFSYNKRSTFAITI